MYALVDATAISGPASKESEAVASRARVELGTLVKVKLGILRLIASCKTTLESAVSPDCDRKINRGCFDIIGKW